MNAISYINGDAQITDFPRCSARPLAALVQSCNDLLAGPSGYLSPEDSVLVLELGWQTVGTADVSNAVIHAWVGELLTSPTWGLVRFATLTTIKAILDIAELHRNAASSDMAPWAAWGAAGQAAHAAARTINPALNPSGLHAIQTAYQSTALADTHYRAALDAVTASALRAYAMAANGTAATRVVELSRHAIHSWRRLAGADRSSDIGPALVDDGPQRIPVPA
ncbi:hypothetical protein [Mycobacterium decipiens]|nr:hypothetical protein [Mycobacterium decipiens]